MFSQPFQDEPCGIRFCGRFPPCNVSQARCSVHPHCAHHVCLLRLMCLVSLHVHFELESRTRCLANGWMDGWMQQAVVLGDGSRVLHYFRPVVEKGGDVPVGHVVEKPLVPMHEAQVMLASSCLLLFAYKRSYAIRTVVSSTRRDGSQQGK